MHAKQKKCSQIYQSSFDESFLEKLEAGVRNYNTIHAKIIPSIKFIIYQGIIPLI